MENINNEDFVTFKENVKKYIAFDDDIKKLEKIVKEKKTEKKKITEFIIEFMSDNGYFAQVVRLGIPDRFIDHGSQTELHTECGYYKDDIVEAAVKLVGISEKAAAS